MVALAQNIKIYTSFKTYAFINLYIINFNYKTTPIYTYVDIYMPRIIIHLWKLYCRKTVLSNTIRSVSSIQIEFHSIYSAHTQNIPKL